MRTSILKLGDNRQHHGQHAGLLLQRYLFENATGEGGNPKEKQELLKAAINAATHSDTRHLYLLAFHRWKKSLPQQTAAITLRTDGRLIVGLGTENVLEAGLRLHHTFGMPLLPGSALKGLAAHYCDQVWGATDQKFRHGADFHQLLFGTTDESGCIIFHDAWFDPDSETQPLKLDVMTPHHPNWLDGSVPPTDFDSPIPVSFLSVAGQFHVAVSWYGPDHVDSEKWTKLTQALLVEALREWGIGSKTTSGYGRLISESESARHAGTAANSAGNPASQKVAKRASGTPVKVRIVGTRGKGYDVQEPGRPQGALTVGNKPPEVQANIGDSVDVVVHIDDPRNPQYSWPRPQPAKPKTPPKKPTR